MKKKMLALIACLCLVLSLAACGSKSDGIVYGAVVPPSDDATGASAELQNGMNAYASSVSKNAKVYTVSGNQETDYETALKEACDTDDVQYVIVDGEEMETAVYAAQKDYSGTDFIFFDGEPREKSGSDADIRKNTLCVTFSEEDQGFLAGYTAVRAGYHTLGYIGGKKTESSNRYFQGFSEGAEYAAKEQGLSSGNVVLNYLFAGTDALTPMRLADAENFYNGGVEIIATDSQTLMPALTRAADDLQKKTAAVGFLYSGSSENVLYSSVGDYNGAVQGILKEAEEKWKGGTVKSAGFQETAVRLSCDFSAFSSFSESDYTAFLEEASGSDFEKSTSDDESAIVTLNEVPMVKANPNSGVGEDSSSENQTAASDGSSSDSVAEASSVPAEADSEAESVSE